MAWFSRLGIWTCRTSPTKDSTSEVMKIPLWAHMMGRTRRSQVSVLSGSMVARGAWLRATSAMGTNSVALLGTGRRAGAGGPGTLIGRTPGPADRRANARRQASSPSKARSVSAAVAEAPAISLSRRADRGIGACPAPAGRSSVRTWSTRRRSAATCAALHQAPGHQAVDDRGHARRPDGQPLGQVGGDGGALVQQAEDPVLGERELSGGQADLDLLGQPGRGATQGLALSGVR